MNTSLLVDNKFSLASPFSLMLTYVAQLTLTRNFSIRFHNEIFGCSEGSLGTASTIFEKIKKGVDLA